MENAARRQAEREEQEARDPLTRTRSLILELGIAREEELTRLEVEAEAEVGAAAQEAVTHPQPDPSSVLDHLYSDSVDSTGPAFDTESTPSYEEDAPLLTMVDLLNACMKDEMTRDPRIVVFGEDVADASREAALEEVKGKGGVFKVTYGLQKAFGGVRVFNSPLAEANIVGRAIGMAVRGLRPVVEIQFFDYIWPAFMQLRDELAHRGGVDLGLARKQANGSGTDPVMVGDRVRREHKALWVALLLLVNLIVTDCETE